MTKREKIYGFCMHISDLFSLFFMIYVSCRGKPFYICYTCSLQGRVCAYTVCHHQKEGEYWNLDFDDNNCDAGTLRLTLKRYY